MSLVPF
jgi:hypothetical protein